MGSQQDHFHYALKSNASWASYKQHSSPQYFEKFAAGQSPTILWLGCSDSRVPETTLLGLQPGEVFVHRNIANIISPNDINSAAVIEYAVAHLKVQHIVLCGHTGCGGALAALGNNKVGGVLDAWLTPLKAVRKANEEDLEAIADEKQRAVRLAELNVENGVKMLEANIVVEEAMKGRGLKVHGCIYDVGCGLIRDLGCGSEGAGVTIVGSQKEEVVRGNHGVLVFGGESATMTVR